MPSSLPPRTPVAPRTADAWSAARVVAAADGASAASRVAPTPADFGVTERDVEAHRHLFRRHWGYSSRSESLAEAARVGRWLLAYAAATWIWRTTSLGPWTRSEWPLATDLLVMLWKWWLGFFVLLGTVMLLGALVSAWRSNPSIVGVRDYLLAHTRFHHGYSVGWEVPTAEERLAKRRSLVSRPYTDAERAAVAYIEQRLEEQRERAARGEATREAAQEAAARMVWLSYEPPFGDTELPTALDPSTERDVRFACRIVADYGDVLERDLGRTDGRPPGAPLTAEGLVRDAVALPYPPALIHLCLGLLLAVARGEITSPWLRPDQIPGGANALEVGIVFLSDFVRL